MARFTVKGGRNGSQVHITWVDGKLSGDPPTVDLVEVEAELARLHTHDRLSWAQVVDPESRLPADPLTEPSAAWHLIVSVLDTVQSADGDLPAEAQAVLAREPRRR